MKTKNLFPVSIAVAVILAVTGCVPPPINFQGFRDRDRDDTTNFTVHNERALPPMAKEERSVGTADVSDDGLARTGRVNEIRMILRRGSLSEARRFFDRTSTEQDGADSADLLHFKGVTYFLSAEKDRSYRDMAVSAFSDAVETTSKSRVRALSLLWLGMTYYKYYEGSENLTKGLTALDRVIDEYSSTPYHNDAILYKALIKRRLGDSSTSKDLLRSLENNEYADGYVYWIPSKRYARTRDAVNYYLHGTSFHYATSSGSSSSKSKAAASGGSAVIADMVGGVMLTSRSVERTAVVGARIGVGDEISTGTNGEVTISMKPAGIIMLGANSAMRVSEMNPKGYKAAVEYIRGDVKFAITKLPKTGYFTVRTPASFLTVQGTTFMVSGNGSSVNVSVLRGVVRVANAAGAASVGALEEANVGAPNTAPVVATIKPSNVDAMKKLLAYKDIANYENIEALNDKLERAGSKAAIEAATVKAEAAERAKVDAEAKVKVEADARANAEARVKVEADARAKAEANARAEADARAKAEAKAKSEADLRIAAEAKAKAEAEARARAEADKAAADKAKAAAEKAKADAEKAKADADAKAKAAATTTTTTTTASTNKAATGGTATKTPAKKDDWDW
ncbi:MAG: FecR domain-containing protein [Spirochaetes bacterium]|nr:FecR domain-containing protein [Spirochaetota bacterium]